MEKWYVSLGDGTFVELSTLPYIFEASNEYIEHLDEWHGGNAPSCEEDGAVDCDMRGHEPMPFNSHIHIKDLVENSVWKDTGKDVVNAKDD